MHEFIIFENTKAIGMNHHHPVQRCARAHNSHNCSKDIDAFEKCMRTRAQASGVRCLRMQHNVRALGVHYNYSPTVSTAVGGRRRYAL